MNPFQNLPHIEMLVIASSTFWPSCAALGSAAQALHTLAVDGHLKEALLWAQELLKSIDGPQTKKDVNQTDLKLPNKYHEGICYKPMKNKILNLLNSDFFFNLEEQKI